MKKNTIDIITLGCSKNLVDAERLMRQLEVRGYECVHDAPNPQGEIAVVNTCGFIGDAKEESISTILQLVERKKRRKLKRIFVMGCLSERYMADLEAEIPEVDGWVGKFNYLDLIEKIEAASAPLLQGGTCPGYERTVTTPSHYAYLKISEGCNRFCSYCAIPLITGRHTPRPKEELLDEVRWLARQGVKELNIIAQDLSAYPDLAGLVDAIAQVEGVEWIRLHYAYPTDFPYELLPVMRKHKNVCKYLDIALQHATDHMLHQMRRHITAEEQEALIRRIREEVPGIHLRTTLMVGHPGETEEDFEALCDFTRRMRFERMGCFAYSHEDGTYSFQHYEDDVPEEVKERRVDRLMQIQEQIAAEISAEKVGQVLEVMIDREEDDYYIGRTEYDSPEVDCEVLVQKNQALEIGKRYPMRIVGSENFDLYAEKA